MTSKKSDKEMTANSLPALKIGSRVRCTDDNMEGRITWANGVSVKIQWDDGEQVTWRRDSLADRPIDILDPTAADDATDMEEISADAEPNVANNSPAEEATPLPPVAEMTADATEPPPAEPLTPLGDDAEVHPPTVIAEAASEAAVPPKRRRKAPAAAKEKKTSALEESVQVLSEAGQALNCQELIAAMAEKGYWTSPGGKTPHATLYTVVTMVPKWAPDGASVKRARIDPVSDSDLFGLDLDAFHQAANDFPTLLPVGTIESVMHLLGKAV